MPNKTKKLQPNQLCRSCSPSEFKFKTTEQLAVLEGAIGQDRALSAVSFGISIKSHGYHIYALGPTGSGKTTIIRKLLEKEAQNKPAPNDWLYVNNFENRDKPYYLNLPAGMGKEFKEDMDLLVEELKTETYKVFESKEYAKEQEKIEQDFQKHSKELFEDLEKKAEKKGFVLLQTAHGIMPLPTSGDKVLTPEQHAGLSEKERKKIESTQEELSREVRETIRLIESLQKTVKASIRDLDRRVISFAVDHLLNSLFEKYKKFKAVINYLNEAKAFLLKNVPTFKQLKQSEQASMVQMLGGAGGGNQEPTFEEYRVNLIVDNSKTKGVPVIFERNPIGPNLVGRIEQRGYFGTLVTNFSMIKSGSLHRANGGYLIIDALELLQKPYAWQMLKRALKGREVMIENMYEAFGAFATRTLEPEPIPLDLKILLIGDPYIYYLLSAYDQDFRELFKVMADFEPHMKWDKESVQHYASFIGNICREENLKHFEPSAVAQVVEYGSRAVSHQNKLSTNFGEVVDIVRQSSYWANQNGNKTVKAADVKKALDEKIYRSSRIDQQIQEMIAEGTIMIDTDGEVVGQINGLSVMQIGDYSFGKPSRITARTYSGAEGVISIDREVKLGGTIHNKGTMILAGYLGGKYASEYPVSFTASLTFEQLYEGVEGDSASSTEIYALLSSLSGYPIRQGFAVTGSVNQFGEIQPIGGVNDKIEGFFQVCKAKGLTGKQGVIIPATNVNHLMLRDYVIDAVKAGKFHIYAVTTIDEGIELLTGISAGERKKDGAFPKNTVNWAVQNKLIELTKNIQSQNTKNNRKKKPKTKRK